MLIDCPYCDNARTQYDRVYEGLTEHVAPYGQVQEIAAKCVQCAGLIVAKVSTSRPNTVIEYHPRVVVGKGFPDVPDAIAGTASEAHICLSVGAPRGAVALARAAVESTAKARGIDKGVLEQKIDKLAEQGAIREDTRQAAHEVRHYGNEVAHGDLVDEPVSLEEAAEVLILMDMILSEVFQQGARLRKLQETREKRLRGESDGDPAQPAPVDLGQGRRAPIAAMARRQRMRGAGEDSAP